MTLVALLASSCGGASLGGARTYYEALDLSSPRSAVETFADAFGRNDFMTVWLVLDATSQDEIRNDFNLLHYAQIFDTAAFPDYQNAIATAFADLTSWESHDYWYLFDQLMLIANRHDAFLIDLSGHVQIINEAGGAVEGWTDVTAEVEGIEGDVTFRMTQSRTGRWKVFQVVVPGGDMHAVPWSVPTSSGAAPTSWSAPDPPDEWASGLSIGTIPSGYSFAYNEGHETATFHVFVSDAGTSQFAVGRQLPPVLFPTAGRQIERNGRVFTVNDEVRVFEELTSGVRLEVLSQSLDEATLLEIAQSVSYDPARDR